MEHYCYECAHFYYDVMGAPKCVIRNERTSPYGNDCGVYSSSIKSVKKRIDKFITKNKNNHETSKED